MKEVFREVETHMKHAVDHLHHELKHVRTGRASIAMLDPVVVEYYGTMTPLNQVASLTVADANLIVAHPYDPSSIQAIQRGISQANLGLNPSSDGKVVRIPIPSLTEDRRKELVKKAHDYAEHARNGVRQARREGNDKLKALEKKHEISQDDERRGLDEVQRLHDHYIKDINDALAHKEKDILTL
jgi:ribosome recycling factor